MGSPDLPNAVFKSRKRARQSSPDRSPSEQTPASTQRSRYVPGLEPRERVDMVLAELHDKHRWTIKDLLYHMVLAQPINKNGYSTSYRARKLSDAIYGQPEVIARLGSVSKDIYITGTSDFVSRIQSELRGLIKGDILGEFESNADPGDMDIPSLATRMQNKSLELWGLLVSIMTPPESSRDTSKVYQGSILMIFSILASGFAPRKSNNFPILIGLYLHAMGVKRRVISFLAGLGINSPYKTIMDRRKELADLGQVLWSKLL
jgi:hypothetical protein